jgi:hypothetical protein
MFQVSATTKEMLDHSSIPVIKRLLIDNKNAERKPEIATGISIITTYIYG